MSYLRNAGGRRATPQSEPIPDAGQVPNSAGGYAWQVDPLVRLRRFLVLGAEGGSYYATERELVRENVQCLTECDPAAAISLIVRVSDEGLAPKNDPALFALAHYAAHESTQVRQLALAALPRVARTSTHLFHFAEYVQAQRGWGRSLRRAIGGWYASQDAADVAFQAVKYRQRDGWTHRDLLRLAHPGRRVSSGNPTDDYISPEHSAVFDWVAHGTFATDETFESLRIIEGFERAQRAETPADTARLIEQYRLPREALKTEHLTDPVVWDALLAQGMPLGALVRNLPTMTRVGLLRPGSDATRAVLRRLDSEEDLRRSRIHPLQVLVAHLTYAAGRSVRGSATWIAVPQIVDGLDAAFYKAFGNVEATGKRWLIALDVSGSMDSGMVNGVPGLTPRVASAAMAMVLMATGDPYQVIAFTSGSRGWGSTAITPLPLSARQRLDDVCRTVGSLPFGGTDCALPWIYAAGEGLQIDACVTLTDSETWAGTIHPSQALKRYREQSGIDARSIVVGMVSNGFSIAAPDDPYSMDVVGFDQSAPQLITAFAKGEI